jgi:hypothetical protein
VIIIHRGRKVAEGSVEALMGREVQYVEIVFSPPPPPEWISVAGISGGAGFIQGNTFVLRAAGQEEASRRISEFRQAGSLVVSCVPVKKRLEEIYVEQVGGGRPGGDRHGG